MLFKLIGRSGPVFEVKKAYLAAGFIPSYYGESLDGTVCAYTRACDVDLIADTKLEAPELESHCGSWVAVSRDTGKAVLETFERSVAERINREKYDVLTAAQYLGELNAKIKDQT